MSSNNFIVDCKHIFLFPPKIDDTNLTHRAWLIRGVDFFSCICGRNHKLLIRNEKAPISQFTDNKSNEGMEIHDHIYVEGIEFEEKDF